MRSAFTLGLCVFLISFGAFAQEKVTIGCTTKCSFLYSHALKRISKRTGIQIRIIDLSKSDININEVDGVVIPGGADIDPKYYLPFVDEDLREYTRKLDHLVEYSKEGERRDPFEYGFLKNYFGNESLKNLPILGICRGMQMLAASQGIPLYVDIKTELGIRNRRYLFDRIRIEDEESLMKELFPALTFLAFKQHHQGIRVNYYLKHQSKWPNVKVTSYSNENTIAESMEFTNRPVLGVQFHPERDFGYERKSIFSWLLNKASKRRSLRN